jgi:hypothetical protein
LCIPKPNLGHEKVPWGLNGKVPKKFRGTLRILNFKMLRMRCIKLAQNLSSNLAFNGRRSKASTKARDKRDRSNHVFQVLKVIKRENHQTLIFIFPNGKTNIPSIFIRLSRAVAGAVERKICVTPTSSH